MKWRRLAKESMPEVNLFKGFLLWIGLRDDDGGFPCIAKHVQYGENPPYIRYVKPSGWHVLEKESYRDCLWAEIDTPERVKRKRERANG